MDRLKFANELLLIATDLETKKIEYKNCCKDLAKKILGNSERIFETYEEIEQRCYSLLSEQSRLSEKFDTMISEIVRLDFEEEESEGHPNEWN